MVKNPPANTGDVRDTGSSPGSGTHSSYSCLENRTDREAWRATVHEAAKSWAWLRRLSAAQHSMLSLAKAMMGNFSFLVLASYLKNQNYT